MAGVAVAKHPDVIRHRIEGHSVTEIAERLGVSPTAVSQTLGRPDVQAEIERMRRAMLDDIRDGWAFVQRKAWRTMMALLDSDNEQIRHKAAADILDRGPMQRGASVSVDATVSIAAQLEGLSLAQLRALAGEDVGVMVIDHEPGEAK